MSRGLTILQSSLPRFRTGSATHAGRVRERNEDSFLALPEVGLWAVADGMGGHDAGDVASTTVIDALRSIDATPSAAELLAQCEQRVAAAHVELMEIGRERGKTIGTTIAILLIHENYYACVWSGDSRIYLVRDGAIALQSRDHSEIQDLIAAGKLTPDEARNWPRRSAITRAVGVNQELELEIKNGTLQAGDRLVLCSDGLTGHVEDHEILHVVTSDGDAQQACDALIELTLARGATDNVTVIVVEYQPNGGGVPAEHRDIWD
jgi:serine/threonine protein phosphatase PrpC